MLEPESCRQGQRCSHSLSGLHAGGRRRSAADSQWRYGIIGLHIFFPGNLVPLGHLKGTEYE